LPRVLERLKGVRYGGQKGEPQKPVQEKKTAAILERKGPDPPTSISKWMGYQSKGEIEMRMGEKTLLLIFEKRRKKERGDREEGKKPLHNSCTKRGGGFGKHRKN